METALFANEKNEMKKKKRISEIKIFAEQTLLADCKPNEILSAHAFLEYH